MESLLVVLAFAPVLLGLAWIFTAPSSQGSTLVKIGIKLPIAVAFLGGIFAQIAYLCHNISLHDRRFYVYALLIVEVIPMSYILIRPDLRRRISRSANHTDANGL